MPRKKKRENLPIEDVRILMGKIDQEIARGKTITEASAAFGLKGTKYYSFRNRLKRAGDEVKDLRHPDRAIIGAKGGKKKRKYKRRTMLNPLAANLANETEDDGLESYDKPELIRTLRRERIETKQRDMRTASKMGSLLNMVGSTI